MVAFQPAGQPLGLAASCDVSSITDLFVPQHIIFPVLCNTPPSDLFPISQQRHYIADFYGHTFDMII
ncbi:hypothetical protein DPMN_092791 [Dreissena polymorpha]|uniref:Uncharacterized protein n=1 Tax=Dreissena polymorpha TaxID=45954 RepID=A0A9D4R212_DREPO|nr:hypothetical protein DPMN_092791 [Dreissena polymorpha]